MARVHYIPNWGTRYEVAESRKRKTKAGEPLPLKWVAIPTAHDGRGYRRVVARKEACELLAAYTAVLQVAARMPRRGVLADEAGPLDAGDLAGMTGLPEKAFSLAFTVLVDPKIDWLGSAESAAELTPAMLGEAAGLANNPPAPAGRSPTAVGAPPATVDATADVSPTAAGASPTAVDKTSPTLHYRTLQDSTEQNGTRTGHYPTRPDKTKQNKTGPVGADRAGPVAQPGLAGSDRAGAKKGRAIEAAWCQPFVLKLIQAFGLQGERALAQRDDFSKVASHIYATPERERHAAQLLCVAAEKAACARLKKPVAAWRTAVGEMFPPLQRSTPHA